MSRYDVASRYSSAALYDHRAGECDQATCPWCEPREADA